MHKGKMASKREMEVTIQENLLPWTTPSTLTRSLSILSLTWPTITAFLF